MKTRAGFVSNSSSSSFILVFDKKPESVADVFQVLFNGLSNEMVTTSWSEPGEGIGRLTAAEDVWGQIETQDSLTLAQVTEEFRNGYDPDFPETDWKLWATASEAQKTKMNKDHEEECDKIADMKAKSFCNQHKGKFLCSVSFSDNDGEFGSIMEHGNAFDRIPHEVFSHH